MASKKASPTATNRYFLGILFLLPENMVVFLYQRSLPRPAGNDLPRTNGFPLEAHKRIPPTLVTRNKDMGKKQEIRTFYHFSDSLALPAARSGKWARLIGSLSCSKTVGCERLAKGEKTGQVPSGFILLLWHQDLLCPGTVFGCAFP
jgi:hypothetical protein